MEQLFQHGHHVRLRSRVHGLYLHADNDGHGVSLRHRRDSMNVAWAVQVHDAEEECVLLQSAAYGRYLAATATAPPAPRSHRIIQRSHNHPGLLEIIWEVHMSGFGTDVELRLRRAGAGTGYLSANGKYLRWKKNGVSVDGIDNVSLMMHWVVEPIPAAAEERIPHLLPRQTGVPLPGSLTRLLHAREIVCEEVGADGVHINHGAFDFRGRSVFRLRKKLVRRLGIANLLPISGPHVMAGFFHSSSTSCPSAARSSTSSSSRPGRLPMRCCGTRMSMPSREMPEPGPLEVALLFTSSEVSPPRTQRHESPVPFVEI